MADGQGTILMTDARYDKHVNAAPLDIIADLGSRRPEKVDARSGKKGSRSVHRLILLGFRI
jgi:hypothetical protein